MTCKITKSIFKQRLQRYPYAGVSLIPTTVSAWALKIPLSQKSRYLGTYVFFVEYVAFCSKIIWDGKPESHSSAAKYYESLFVSSCRSLTMFLELPLFQMLCFGLPVPHLLGAAPFPNKLVYRICYMYLQTCILMIFHQVSTCDVIKS